MTSPQPAPIKLELIIQPEQPELLRGLEQWLQLGLLSDIQVKRIARSYLCCPMPSRVTLPQPDFIADPLVGRRDESPSLTGVGRREPLPGRRRDESPGRRRDESPSLRREGQRDDRGGKVDRSRVAQPSLLAAILTSLMAELSVVWLLFLGVFMVVVSSAVLAASQWQNFSALGQYGILWAYTLMFGFAGLMASQRSTLRLTGQMLQATTLLIIPVNFWMIDGFNLWRSPMAWGLGLMAALSLVVMMLKLLQQSSQIDVFNTIGLSILQWGWAIPGLPLVATYIGTVGTAALQISRRDPTALPASDRPGAPPLLDVGKSAIAFATILLVARATLAQGIPLSQLGLAIGICGWLLCWDNRRVQRPLLSQVGAGLLALGWLVTVSADQLWQAIGISCLILGLLGERLHRLWLVQDTVAIIFVGLQTYTLLRVIFPPTFRKSAIALIAKWAHLQQGAWELTGLGFFAYLIIMLLGAVYLRRKQQPKLALVTEQLALGFGGILLLPGLDNPLVRAVYLSWSAVTLAVVLWRRSHLPWLIYLTHTTTLAAVLTWIAWGWPDLPQRSWAAILLIGMGLEWGGCWLTQNRAWQLSSWYLGVGLAASSYPLWEGSSPENLAWLFTPLLLIGLARRAGFPHPQTASWLSVMALVLVPTLTEWNTIPFLISLVIATALMAVNTKRLLHPISTAITVGFGLATLATTATKIWQPFPTEWIPVGLAIALWGLWLLRHGCHHRASRLANLYADALNGWAIALCLGNLLALTGIAVGGTFDYTPLTWHHVLAIGLTMGAIGYRILQHPTELGVGGVAWGAELLAISSVHLAGGNWQDLAMVNLALGLGTQLVGDWLGRRSPLVSQHAIPPLYATLGLIGGHTDFTATTGLFTLAAAVISIGVGRRQATFKSLTYLGIVGISIAAYELLLNQIFQATGGKPGDAVTLLAGLAALIAIAYRLLTPLLLPYWRLTRAEIQPLGQLHWGIGSSFATIAVLLPLSSRGDSLWLGVMAMLALYALWLGRQQSIWVYAGIGEGLAVVGHALHRSLPEAVLVTWGAAIACLIAFLLYQLPWRNWGWEKEPWQNSAIGLPGLAVLLTSHDIGIATLLITGGFYAWLALTTQQIRLTYLSLGLADWAILRIFRAAAFIDPLWSVAVLSGSILYGVQIDPALQRGDRKETRHLLRSLAVGLFCLTALYQSDHNWGQGLITIAASLGLIIAGLVLRTRAYLYVGTLTFMAKVLLQLWAFISDYSLLLWALGILLGLVFIWVAATFEARRSQTIALLQYWITELDRWE